MLLFFLATVNNLTGEGPLWNLLIGYKTESCEKNWWVTLLYIVNYYKPVEATVSARVKLTAGFSYWCIFLVHNPRLVSDGGHAVGTSRPDRDLPHAEMA